MCHMRRRIHVSYELLISSIEWCRIAFLSTWDPRPHTDTHTDTHTNMKYAVK